MKHYGSLVAIPPQYVYVKNSILRSTPGADERGLWHAITVENNHRIYCHVLFESGFQYSDLSLEDLKTRENLHLSYPEEVVEPYACLSSEAQVIVLPVLEKMEVCTRFNEHGMYLFSIQFLGKETWQNLAEQRKILHCIRLNSGWFTLLPNNYLLWCDEAVTQKLPSWPTGLKRNQRKD